MNQNAIPGLIGLFDKHKIKKWECGRDNLDRQIVYRTPRTRRI